MSPPGYHQHPAVRGDSVPGLLGPGAHLADLLRDLRVGHAVRVAERGGGGADEAPGGGARG